MGNDLALQITKLQLGRKDIAPAPNDERRHDPLERLEVARRKGYIDRRDTAIGQKIIARDQSNERFEVAHGIADGCRSHENRSCSRETRGERGVPLRRRIPEGMCLVHDDHAVHGLRNERIAGERGLTLLFTEHDMDVVFSIAQKIGVLHQGRLIAEGTPTEVRAHPEVRRIYLGERH